LATYGRFVRVGAICVLFLVGSELVSKLAFRVSHATMIALAVGILVLASLFIRRDQLKASLRRAQHRRSQHPI
jgi:hypothetical protein